MGVLSPFNDFMISPAGFHIVGFNYLKFIDSYLIFLTLVYIVTVLFNSFIISIIWIDNRLHTPKYVAVANLAFVDLMFSTTIIPSMIKIFLAKESFISYNACLTQMFFYYLFVSLESLSLSILAYDRLIAICFPLRRSSVNTIAVMISIIVAAWSFCVGVVVFAVTIMTRLSFCDSVNVQSYFCDYTPMYRLSCNDNRLQWSTASALSLLIVFGPLSLIVLSYACILTAVFRMNNLVSSYKALVTCTEHLILVAIFYGPIMTVYIIELFFFRLDPDVRILNLSLAKCIPPFLNPIVYSLATKEIKNRILALFRKFKLALIEPLSR